MHSFAKEEQSFGWSWFNKVTSLASRNKNRLVMPSQVAEVKSTRRDDQILQVILDDH